MLFSILLWGCGLFESVSTKQFKDTQISLYDGEYATKFQKKILIDPGHGCTDNGAKGSLGMEKDSNWELANTIVEHLNSTGKFKASLTRKTKDEGCPKEVWKRGRMANGKGMDAFISIHADGPATNLEGSWIIWSNQRMAKKSWTDNKLLANVLGASLDKYGFKLFNMKAHFNDKTLSNDIKYLTTNDRYGVHIDNNKKLAVLRNTTKPAVLIETYWLQNPKESTYFAKKETQQKYAQAIELGLHSFFAAKDGLYSPESLNDNYTVQVFASSNKKEVMDFIKPLKKSLNLKEKDYSISDFKRGKETWYRLRVGQFATIQDAEKFTEKLEKQEITEYWITSPNAQ